MSRILLAISPVDYLSPKKLWQHLAVLGRRYILIGDTDHGNTAITQEVAKALPILADTGVRHLGIEQSDALMGAALRRYHTARTSERRSGDDARRLRNHLSQYVSMFHTDETNGASLTAEFNLHQTARESRVHVHCLGLVPMIDDYLAPRNLGDKKDRLIEIAAHVMTTSTFPQAAPRHLCLRAMRLLMQYDRNNLNHDRKRARVFRAEVGTQRGALFYGAGHFRRNRVDSIDRYLPLDESVYVQIGAKADLEKSLRACWRDYHGSVPDFALTTDTQEGWVLPPALRNGLWPKAGAPLTIQT